MIFYQEDFYLHSRLRSISPDRVISAENFPIEVKALPKRILLHLDRGYLNVAVRVVENRLPSDD